MNWNPLDSGTFTIRYLFDTYSIPVRHRDLTALNDTYILIFIERKFTLGTYAYTPKLLSDPRYHPESNSGEELKNHMVSSPPPHEEEGPTPKTLLGRSPTQTTAAQRRVLWPGWPTGHGGVPARGWFRPTTPTPGRSAHPAARSTNPLSGRAGSAGNRLYSKRE
ncbi:hypothetical protein P167DRAFT_548488 [Morchella conica CCBAS932]|uniref:Uncharacterized protein n=1 Tax=Morchella conica CCBAS932 TaxID=1392247 RepID=A0A3N4KED6_9PEZI|nr:hypothetical protein P167DRAFT_548488 [Morchella conica CCBAS932]